MTNPRITARAIVGVVLITLAGTAQAAQDPSPSQQAPRDREHFKPGKVTDQTVPTKDTPVSRAPVTVTLISGPDLEEAGVRFLTDVFRLAPGLEVQRMSSTESNVSVRSYNDDSSASQGVLGLIDGRQAYNEFFGGVLWDTLPVSLDEIQQVEIIRGPGSFVHGPNAMHGLVNIVTRSPLTYRDNEIHVHGLAGSYRSNLETLTYVRREESAALKVKVGHDDIDEFEPAGLNAKDKRFLELRFETFLGGMDHRIDITAGVSEQKFNVLIPTFGGLPAATFASEGQETYGRGLYTWDGAWGGLRLQATWTRFDAVGEPDGVYAPFHLLLDAADVDLQYSLVTLHRNSFSAGVGYRYASFDTEDQDISQGRHWTRLGWFFVQDEIAVTDSLWFTGGLRMDDHSVSSNVTSPRFAVVWRIDGPDEPANRDVGHFVRGTAGYGFRNPSLRELWFDMPVLGGAATITGNRDLEAEKIRSFELGYWGQFLSRVRVESTIHYNLVDRLVEFQPTSATTFAPMNARKEDAYGIETRIEVRINADLSVFANHSYELRRDRETHERNPSGPLHKANAGVRVEPATDLVASAWATFFDDVTFLDPASGGVIGSVEDYLLLNARVAYRVSGLLKDAQVFVQAFNLLDHDHREQPQGDPYGLLLMGGVEIAW
jgi:iron complex outermembrane receptor protein